MNYFMKRLQDGALVLENCEATGIEPFPFRSRLQSNDYPALVRDGIAVWIQSETRFPYLLLFDLICKERLTHAIYEHGVQGSSSERPVIA